MQDFDQLASFQVQVNDQTLTTKDGPIEDTDFEALRKIADSLQRVEPSVRVVCVRIGVAYTP